MVSVNLEPCLSFANTAWGTDPQQWPPRALSRATAAEWSKGACTLALQPHQGGGSSWPLGKSPFIMLLVSGEVSSSCHPSLLAVVVHSLHLRSYITAWCILPGPDLVKAFLAPGAAKGIYPNRVGPSVSGEGGEVASSPGEELLEEGAGALWQSCTKAFPVSPSSLLCVCLPTQPTLPCFHTLKKGLTSSSEKLVIWGQGHTQGCPDSWPGEDSAQSLWSPA